MGQVLEIKNLTKKYGNFIAVNNLSLKINSGEIFGILGPNGCGKTTTLGMLLGVINNSSGSYAWFNKPDFENCRRQIGAILEHPIFYPELSAAQNLEITAKIKQCSLDRIEVVLKRVGLFSRKDSKFRTYSLGMKQRLALASAMLSDPDVLVLDEPTNGLDPQGINQMRSLILSIAAEGKTIIISSHLLDEIQKMCTHVAILKKGTLIKAGSIEEILQAKKTFEIRAEIESTLLIDKIKAIKNVLKVDLKDKTLIVSCDETISATKLNENLIKEGIIVSHLTEHKASLEEEFLNLVS
jgi:ABC-2 type transport system ATP-binding protein